MLKKAKAKLDRVFFTNEFQDVMLEICATRNDQLLDAVKFKIVELCKSIEDKRIHASELKEVYTKRIHIGNMSNGDSVALVYNYKKSINLLIISLSLECAIDDSIIKRYKSQWHGHRGVEQHSALSLQL